jgi:hypothetical protein
MDRSTELSASRFLPGLVICLLLFCVTLAIYSPSFRFGFINYDDERVLLDHPELYNQPTVAGTLKAIVLENYPREEPLLVRDISWAMDSRTFGFRNPAGYHRMNVVLHAIVVVLLFVFLYLTTLRLGASLITTILFLALAVHVEPVAWVMGRKDILSGLFALLCLTGQCKMLTAERKALQYVWYLFSLLCFVLALFSKISVCFLPGVLFLHMVLFKHLRSEVAPESPCPWRFAFTRALPLVIPHVLIAITVAHWYFGVLSQYGVLDRAYSATLPQHIWNLAIIDPLVMARYIVLIFAPHNLSMFYTWPDLSPHFGWLQIAASFSIIIGCAFVGIWLWLRRKDLVFYYFSFFMLMVSYLNLKYIGIWMASRYLYLSSFCVLAIAVSLVFPPQGRIRSKVAGILGVAFLLACGVFNLAVKFNYQSAWQNNETLWSHEISLPATRIFAYDSLASFYYTRGTAEQDPKKRDEDLNRIESVVEKAEARFWPDRQQPPPHELYTLYFVKALVAQVNKEPPDSQLQALKKAEELNPRFHAVLFELAVFYYRRALESGPDSREALARTSLDYFAKYARYVLKDSTVMKQISDMKAMYAADFPFLAGDLAAIPGK